jgi:PfaD family protein
MGDWSTSDTEPAFTQKDLADVARRCRQVAHVIVDPTAHRLGVGIGGSTGGAPNGRASWPFIASLPPVFPEWLGDRSFAEAHGVRFPYVTGAMANGIASVELVVAMARADFLGFFGAAGLTPAAVESAVDAIERSLGSDLAARPTWGSNLIHSPNEPALEEAVVDIYLRRGVRRVEAAAFMSLTPSVVRYSASGLHLDRAGCVVRPNMVFAKVSREEVARQFMEPPPSRILDGLVAAGALTQQEAQLASRLPVAEDYTVESDSGGHTDNRPLSALFPVIARLRDEVCTAHGYTRPVRLGAAGGIGTPAAVAGAFAMGADFVITGSVNQGCVESGLHADGKEMLAQAGIADVAMAPAADMFELGVEVQVLKRGTMFASRAHRLRDLYRSHASLDEITGESRDKLERDILRTSIGEAWAGTRSFWVDRDPSEVERAESDGKHKMALVFRSYLGQASKWAIAGDTDRRLDYQIWCGPAMGAFNSWVRGSFLEHPQNRSVVQVARNLMEGAAVVTRAQQLRSFGVPMPPSSFDFEPEGLS